MTYPLKHNIPYNQIDNGALVLMLLKECKNWTELCSRYYDANPNDLIYNTNSRQLYDKLVNMKAQRLIEFEEEGEGETKTLGAIRVTDHWTKIRMALGGIHTTDVALISGPSKGMAVTPYFGRPEESDPPVDVFVLMPFDTAFKGIYNEHIKPLGAELGISIMRADDVYAAGPFMQKVWNGICSAHAIIADCTTANPNVFYEIGVAHTVGRPVMLITRSKEDVRSDIQHLEYIVYEDETKAADVLIPALRNFIIRKLKLGEGWPR